ncbi:Carnitine transport ATP-binding protein OpuCA [compost metagenome]
MDEPFGAVDEITRKSLQEEILRIHKELGVTIIFITHDIKEALKLGSKVLIMDKGEIIQLGTPDEIKSNPKNSFVKELISSEL